MSHLPPSAPEPNEQPPSYESVVSGDAGYPEKGEFEPLTAGATPQHYPPQRGCTSQHETGFQGPVYTAQPQGGALLPQNTAGGQQGLYPSNRPPQPANPYVLGYAPGPGGQTVIVQQPGPTRRLGFGDVPVQVTCPVCRASVVTSVTYEAGTLTFVVCAILCLVGCDAGCCLIPFCADGCKDVEHVCPNCGSHVGRYNRL